MIFPNKGDVIIVDAEPHAGHEMGGHDPSTNNIRRHYVVMSTNSYNHATHMFLGFPITTSNYENNPRYLPILINGSNGTGVKGYIVLWQLQNFDFVARHGKIINHLNKKTIDLLQEYVEDIVGKE
ncbi:type II toxin-antitoxin system PemK/MazF family toxin [Lactobacillus sp. PV037]|uniref:type II toxin-antitoxin system PemK/MazF family toxin n=1 Tax=unclassified Lactobacillus TaxID=2620435 RepID=UPI002240BFF4|nr:MULTISPECIES: type II toxin-antitoxin system PemK/MazF family toxin [unclassified Lactobacillus]QNQ82253.1 type II toxin-antitoxin system PemK/MazF family toxin [Lactobacillus sp. PV012]QNQ83636.1 type II toxin-antitoxin system PemK/MazF family toxin [Lactobacillus sp. PV037]